MSDTILNTTKCWYALRDLKRSNAIQPAFKLLTELGIEVFTPTQWRLVVRNGKKVRREVAVMHDLLFAYDTRKNLDPIIAKTETLQYRYKRGGKYCEPIIVPEDDMNRFINAVRAAEEPKYYSVDEISSLNCGKQIRIVGGQLDGQEGKLLTVRGSKVKRLVIELKNLLAVSVEIKDEYIQLMQ
jgi:transcription antitermination factor NusG